MEIHGLVLYALMKPLLLKNPKKVGIGHVVIFQIALTQFNSSCNFFMGPNLQEERLIYTLCCCYDYYSYLSPLKASKIFHKSTERIGYQLFRLNKTCHFFFSYIACGKRHNSLSHSNSLMSPPPIPHRIFLLF